ncbi:response regulator transcription factor [Konateibacter massiliensis]|uniref:response regulator transcription factor n=1 Tax=Konateibacter massiliensis TaxID=2002841 RepID=UPI000C151E3C|nr:response regulator [Konateibacter massiliensis]
MYKVMLIDDEPIIVEGLSRSVPWEKWNCEVIATAHDGLEGKERIEEYKPNIVFMDICMPEMDGLQMIAALKSQYEDMEVSILTGFRDFEYAQRAIRLGVSRFLLKPSNMEEIEEAIETMCGNLAKKDIGVSQKTDKAQAHEKASGSFIVKNALKYINENYTEKLTLSEVAEKTYVSQWHLSKLLNGHTGQSFSEILNCVRIQEAKKLLENPALRIGDISISVGFQDLAHFSRVFKKQEGISANEYRNKILSR